MITDYFPLKTDKRKIEESDVIVNTVVKKQKDSIQLEIPSDWLSVLEREITKDYFTKMISKIEKDELTKTIYPPVVDRFSFMRYPLKNIKVVIIGQGKFDLTDPYHGEGQAHGLCFSVRKGIQPPPSLINIYKELEKDIDGFSRPAHGCLEGWAKQGVLLLNATLTVRKVDVATYGWAQFTDFIIHYLNQNHEKLVFMLWGGFAQKKAKKVDKKRHLVLTATHPSPLGANKGGWFGCNHFSKANAYLKENGKEEIDWKQLP